LDTNVISELRRPSRANPNVVAWFESTSQAKLFLSVITLLEIETGILLLEHRGDYAQAAPLRLWMARILSPALCRWMVRCAISGSK
jgi:predicted nucleic acid-binding protein